MKFAALFLLLLLSSCKTYPIATTPSASGFKEPKSHALFVVSHGKHTGLIVDGDSVNQQLPALAELFGQPAYYEIGWGDAGFYRSPKVTSGLAINAIFMPTPAIIHVVALNEHPQEAFPFSEVVSLNVSPTHYRQMLGFIDSSFKRNDEQKIIHQGPGIYGQSAFYDAIGRYYLFNTCNKWTAKGLRSAGLPVEAVTPITSSDVMNQVRENSVLFTNSH
ncbi:MAG: TIGR02117 family protein [Luteolibacter sp.]